MARIRPMHLTTLFSGLGLILMRQHSIKMLNFTLNAGAGPNGSNGCVRSGRKYTHDHIIVDGLVV